MKLKLKSLALFLICTCGVCCASINEVSAGKGRKKSVSSVVVLREPADVNRVDAEGMTSLHHYAKDGKRSMVVQLVKSFRADVSKKDKNGKTPLHHAAQWGRSFTVRWLLKHGGASKEVNTQDIYGKTPLHYAISLPIPDTAKYLVECGADLSIRDNTGKTPREYASDQVWYVIQSMYAGREHAAAAVAVPRRTFPALPVDVAKTGGPTGESCGTVVEVTGLSGSVSTTARVKSKRPSAGASQYKPHAPLPVVYVGRKRARLDVSGILSGANGASCDDAAASSFSSSSMFVDSTRGRVEGTGIAGPGATTPDIETRSSVSSTVEASALEDDSAAQAVIGFNLGTVDTTEPGYAWEARELFHHDEEAAYPLSGDLFYPYDDSDLFYYQALYPSLMPPEYKDFLP